MTYLNELEQTTNETLTENLAKTNESTLDPVLDFFSRAGAMRGNIDDAVLLFRKAIASNSTLAMKALFYLRDIREGLGERDIFRACFKSLSEENQAHFVKFIPEYGRWDDLFIVDDIKIVAKIIRKQLMEDFNNYGRGKGVSLLAKWMPSENTSSEKTRKLAKALIQELDVKPRQHRKMLTKLRTHIDILETKMSARKWKDINYEKLPSQAQAKHVGAFYRHDDERYNKYLADVTSGEKKINTGTLMTYEVFDVLKKDEKAADVMWNNLPDHTRGENALVVADVSASMQGRPMDVSISLALYFAERNKGIFKNYFMTFSEKPQLVRVIGSTLKEKLDFISRADWDMNTNIEAAFKAILDAAVKGKVKQSELPSTLYIISDMEFDRCIEDDETNYNNAKQKFADAGYKLPQVIFWNVDARNAQSPATKYDSGVALVSGLSQSIFKYAVENKSPIEFMKDVLGSERYKKIAFLS